jgi:hypothetical protein
VRELRGIGLLPGADAIEQLAGEAGRVDLVIVLAGRQACRMTKP